MQFRKAVAADAGLLPDVEQSAGLLFRADPEVAWLADGDNLSPERYHEIIIEGWSWVAESMPGQPIAFAVATLEESELHIWEFNVCSEYQRRGIGRRLLQYFIAEATTIRIPAITLTTFRDLPWNAPFYQTIGFEVLAAEQLGSRLEKILAEEARKGLPMARRCAMRMKILF